jgi:hypothetical protein
MGIKEREAKFITLAEKRVNKAIHQLRLVKNLANKSNYSYTDKDASLIVKALMQEVASVKETFKSVSSKSAEDFKLR